VDQRSYLNDFAVVVIGTASGGGVSPQVTTSAGTREDHPGSNFSGVWAAAF